MNAQLSGLARPTIWLAAAGMFLLLTGCAAGESGTETTSQNDLTIDAVKAQKNGQGLLIVGIDGDLPGFSGKAIRDQSSAAGGAFSGIDVDLGLAVAAAIFGNDENLLTRVRFRPTNSQERFDLLINGQVDVLFRNTTWILTRDTNNMRFGAPSFYDGQGFMIGPGYSGGDPKRVLDAASLGGSAICVEQGTTTEFNMTDFFWTGATTWGSHPLHFRPPWCSNRRLSMDVATLGLPTAVGSPRNGPTFLKRRTGPSVPLLGTI